MDLSIIIVSWNVREKLRQNLNAIFGNTQNISFEVFVVDNNSHDGSADMVRQEFSGVKVIANNFNAGFSKANNQALKFAIGRQVLLLNPDMRVFEGTLEKMVSFMEAHPEAGVASCHLINSEGQTIQHVRRFPKFLDQAALILKIPHLIPSILNKYLQVDFDYSQPCLAVDSVRGSFFMISRKALAKLGGLDERYFVWFEEVDYCRQVQNLGLKILYTNTADCLDFVGQSFAQVSGYKKQKMFTKSMLQYFKKWHPFYQYALLAIFRPLGLILAFTNDKYKGKDRH